MPFRGPVPGRLPSTIAAIAALALVIGAADAAAQSLRDTLAAAYRSNPRLLAARAGLRAADERVAQALSGWRPTLTISGEGGISRVDSTETAPRIQSRKPRDAAMTVKQNIYRGGRTRAETRRVDNEVKSERARLIAEEQEVLFAAASVHADVVRDRSVVALTTRNERVLQDQLEATMKRFSGGEVTRTDVSQARSRMLRATAARIKAAGDLTGSRTDYRNVIGTMPPELQPAEPLTGLPTSLTEAVRLARAHAPEAVATRFNERAARDQVRLIQGELLPVVAIEGTVGREYEASATDSRTDSATIALTVTVPLYQAGGVSARIREAKEAVAQQQSLLVRSERDAVAEAARAWKDLETARGRIAAFTEEINAAETALQGVQREALVGTRTILDVLDAEQELLDAQVNLVRAQRDEVVATFALRKAVGGLTAERLGLPVKLYKPEEHYRAARGRWFGTGLSGK